MIFIKKFIDKVSSVEGRQGRDLVLPMDEARGLRDEISKLIADNYNLLSDTKEKDEVIRVEMNGGKW